MDTGSENDYGLETMIDKQVYSVKSALQGFVGGDSLNFAGNFAGNFVDQKVRTREQFYSAKSQSKIRDANLNYVGNFDDHGVMLDEQLYSVQSPDQDINRQGNSGKYRWNVNDMNHGAGGKRPRYPAMNGHKWASPRQNYSPGSNTNSLNSINPGLSAACNCAQSHGTSGQQIYGGQDFNDSGGSVGRGQQQTSQSRPSVHCQDFDNGPRIVSEKNHVLRGQRTPNPAQSATVNGQSRQRNYKANVNPEISGAENEQSYHSAQHNDGVEWNNNQPSRVGYGSNSASSSASSYSVSRDRMREPGQQRYPAQHVDVTTLNGNDHVMKKPEESFEFLAQDVAVKREKEDGRLAIPLKAAQQKNPFFVVKNAIADFVHVRRANYANRICWYDDGQLLKQEAVKTAHRKSSSVSMGKSLDRAPITFGLSLILTACAARRFYIADVKLKLIQIEIKRRGYTPRTQEPVCAGPSGCCKGCCLHAFIDDIASAARGMPAGYGGPFVEDACNREPQANLRHRAVLDSSGQYYGPPSRPASPMPTRAAPISPHLSPIHSNASSPHHSVRWKFLNASYPPGISHLPLFPPQAAAHIVHSRSIPSTDPLGTHILQEPTFHDVQAPGVPWAQPFNFSSYQADSVPANGPHSESSARAGTKNVHGVSASTAPAPSSHIPIAPVYAEPSSVPSSEISMATVYSEPPSVSFTYQRNLPFEPPSELKSPSDGSDFQSVPSAYTPTMASFPKLSQRGVSLEASDILFNFPRVPIHSHNLQTFPVFAASRESNPPAYTLRSQRVTRLSTGA